MKTHTILKLLVVIIVCTQNLTVFAQDMTPVDFLQADVDARQLTLEGMSQQITLLNSGASSDQIYLSVSANEANVEAVFASYGTSAAAHSAYGTKNSKVIETWMREHPEWQQTYDDLNAEFEWLSEQLSTLREGQ
jgi:hypothetical protein